MEATGARVTSSKKEKLRWDNKFILNWTYLLLESKKILTFKNLVCDPGNRMEWKKLRMIVASIYEIRTHIILIKLKVAAKVSKELINWKIKSMIQKSKEICQKCHCDLLFTTFFFLNKLFPWCKISFIYVKHKAWYYFHLASFSFSKNT